MLLLVMFKIKKLKLSLKSIRKFFRRLTDVLIPIVAVSLLLGIIFGIDAPFVGNVYTNVAEIIGLIGQDGLLSLISIIIILAYLKKK
jgi:phosphotransferase system  glucose/maltose/N-acetylglucosamine-specific IIC component